MLQDTEKLQIKLCTYRCHASPGRAENFQSLVSNGAKNLVYVPLYKY